MSTPDIKKEERGLRGQTDKLWFKIFYAAVGSIPLIAALYLALYYIYGPGEGYFHSDCTDTMYWANAALEGNGIFDEQYNYAALLPFSTVWIMQPLIKIFGFGMTAHNLGMAIFALLFAGGIYFCARSAKFSHIWSSTAVFAVFTLLSCSDKLREMMWGHTIYYSLGLILLFYLLGSGMRFADALENKRYKFAAVWGVLLLAISVGSATNGMQVIVLTTLPAVAAFGAERIFAGRDGLISKRSFPTLGSAAVIGAGTLVGLKVLGIITGDTIKAGYAAGYSGWSAVTDWLGNAQKFVNHYFSLLGVDMKKNAPIFDGESLKYFFRIIVGIVLLVMPIVILCLYGKLRSRGVKFMVWAHFVLTAAVMFGYICGELSAANWRLTPILGSAALLTVCGLRDLVSDLGLISVNEKKEICEPTEADAELSEEQTAEQLPESEISGTKSAAVILSRVCSLVLAAVLLSSFTFAKEIKALDPEYGRDNTNHRLAQFLIDEGLEYGYATFWYSQAITVLTNSQVRVRNMDVNAQKGVIGRHYQSSLNWYNDQEGIDEYFIILNSSEYEKVRFTDTWDGWMDSCYVRHYEDPNDAAGFRIYVFSENVLAYFGSDARQ